MNKLNKFKSNKPFKICKFNMCNELTKEKYCIKHKQKGLKEDEESNKERHKNYNSFKRNNELHKFYHTTNWKKTREFVKEKYKNLCATCLKEKRIKIADVVDHKVPLEVDFDKGLDIDNLQCLCHSCHNKKTRLDKKIYKL